MISAKNALFSFLFALFTFLPSRPAQAQVHWDANVQAGFSRRFFSGNPNSAGITGSNGPTVGLEGDVALIPLLRIGAYADYESAYTGEPKPPQAFSFGGRLKLAIPGNRSNVHWWLFTGFGAVAWEAPGYQQLVAVPSGSNLTTVSADVQSASGYFLEIPLGVGAGWRFHRPWELVMELQGRFGLDMNGSYFTDNGTGNGLTRPATVPNNAGLVPAITTGSDAFALLFTVGIGLDE